MGMRFPMLKKIGEHTTEPRIKTGMRAQKMCLRVIYDSANVNEMHISEYTVNASIS